MKKLEPSKPDQIFMMIEKNFLIHFFFLRFQMDKNMKFRFQLGYSTVLDRRMRVVGQFHSSLVVFLGVKEELNCVDKIVIGNVKCSQ